MDLLPNPTIASRGVFVKSTFLGDRTKTKNYSRLKPSFRPDVLSKMPCSCNIVFDVLRTMIDRKGQSKASVRDLAQLTRLGTTVVWRALRRLRGAHLIDIATGSRGAQGTTWQLRWRSPLCSFPHVSVPLRLIRNKTRELKAFSPNGTNRPQQSNTPSKKALAWVMIQLRKELGTGYRMSKQRKKHLCTGIGVNIWRVMREGKVRAGPGLAAFVREIIFRLQDAQGIGDSQRAWCSWAGWAVQSVIADQRAQRISCEASARLIGKIQREKAESRGSVASFLSKVGASSLSDYVRYCANVV